MVHVAIFRKAVLHSFNSLDGHLKVRIYVFCSSPQPSHSHNSTQVCSAYLSETNSTCEVPVINSLILTCNCEPKKETFGTMSVYLNGVDR
eukprot:6208781-Pleurochrysis_carterae.AAC.3